MTTTKRTGSTSRRSPAAAAAGSAPDEGTLPDEGTVSETVDAPTDSAPEAAPDTSPDAGPDGGLDVGLDVDTNTLDFVTFVVQGETYAFPMDSVEEIIRMPQVVRVPLGPPSLEGLANLRGRILPVVSLRACCGLEPVDADEATRVIVVDGGATLGFVVDRVASVTSVDRARVDDGADLADTLDSELLAGVIRPAGEEDELTKVLDVRRLVEGQFSLLSQRAAAVEAASGPLGAGGAAQTAGVGAADRSVERGDDGDDGDTLELVSFAVDGQEYALPIDLVQEIVQAPERVTSVPNAGSRVLGVMDLRGRLLPVVSLRQVFGLAQAPLEPQNRIVVVHVPQAARGTDGGRSAASTASGETGVVGVVMDTVREVLRVPHHLVADLPEFMARGGRAREVDAVCRLEEGTRLVSVLSVERMFGREDVRDALESVLGATSDDTDGAVEGDEEDLTMAGSPVDETGDDALLVTFRLATEEFAVDVDAVQEIIRVPETLIRVPKTLDFVEGLVNLRGAVLPVMDLRTRLGLDRSERDERQRIIVLVVGGVRTGFVVDSVTEVLRVGGSSLQPAPELSPEQAALISRVAHLRDSGRMLMMLEPDHLLATEQLASLIPHQRAGAEEAVLAS